MKSTKNIARQNQMNWRMFYTFFLPFFTILASTAFGSDTYLFLKKKQSDVLYGNLENPLNAQVECPSEPRIFGKLTKAIFGNSVCQFLRYDTSTRNLLLIHNLKGLTGTYSSGKNTISKPIGIRIGNKSYRKIKILELHPWSVSLSLKQNPQINFSKEKLEFECLPNFGPNEKNFSFLISWRLYNDRSPDDSIFFQHTKLPFRLVKDFENLTCEVKILQNKIFSTKEVNQKMANFNWLKLFFQEFSYKTHLDASVKDLALQQSTSVENVSETMTPSQVSGPNFPPSNQAPSCQPNQSILKQSFLWTSESPNLKSYFPVLFPWSDRFTKIYCETLQKIGKRYPLAAVKPQFRFLKTFTEFEKSKFYSVESSDNFFASGEDDYDIFSCSTPSDNLHCLIQKSDNQNATLQIRPGPFNLKTPKPGSVSDVLASNITESLSKLASIPDRFAAEWVSIQVFKSGKYFICQPKYFAQDVPTSTVFFWFLGQKEITKYRGSSLLPSAVVNENSMLKCIVAFKTPSKIWIGEDSMLSPDLYPKILAPKNRVLVSTSPDSMHERITVEIPKGVFPKISCEVEGLKSVHFCNFSIVSTESNKATVQIIIDKTAIQSVIPLTPLYKFNSKPIQLNVVFKSQIYSHEEKFLLKVVSHRKSPKIFYNKLVSFYSENGLNNFCLVLAKNSDTGPVNFIFDGKDLQNLTTPINYKMRFKMKQNAAELIPILTKFEEGFSVFWEQSQANKCIIKYGDGIFVGQLEHTNESFTPIDKVERELESKYRNEVADFKVSNRYGKEERPILRINQGTAEKQELEADTDIKLIESFKIQSGHKFEKTFSKPSGFKISNCVGTLLICKNFVLKNNKIMLATRNIESGFATLFAQNMEGKKEVFYLEVYPKPSQDAGVQSMMSCFDLFWNKEMEIIDNTYVRLEYLKAMEFKIKNLDIESQGEFNPSTICWRSKREHESWLKSELKKSMSSLQAESKKRMETPLISVSILRKSNGLSCFQRGAKSSKMEIKLFEDEKLIKSVSGFNTETQITESPNPTAIYTCKVTDENVSETAFYRANETFETEPVCVVEKNLIREKIPCFDSALKFISPTFENYLDLVINMEKIRTDFNLAAILVSWNSEEKLYRGSILVDENSRKVTNIQESKLRQSETLEQTQVGSISLKNFNSLLFAQSIGEVQPNPSALQLSNLVINIDPLIPEPKVNGQLLKSKSLSHIINLFFGKFPKCELQCFGGGEGSERCQSFVESLLNLESKSCSFRQTKDLSKESQLATLLLWQYYEESEKVQKTSPLGLIKFMPLK